MRKQAFLLGILAIALLLAVTMIAALVNSGPTMANATGGPTLRDVPTGPLDKDAAIQKATVIARGQSMEPERAFAELMTYQAWATTAGAELGIVMGPGRQVWVVVLRGYIAQPNGRQRAFRMYDNYEVVLDSNTGEYLASGSRNPGVPPPFSVNR